MLLPLLPTDELYLEFRHIDPQQPDLPFGFALQVDAHDRYSGEL